MKYTIRFSDGEYTHDLTITTDAIHLINDSSHGIFTKGFLINGTCAVYIECAGVVTLYADGKILETI